MGHENGLIETCQKVVALKNDIATIKAKAGAIRSKPPNMLESLVFKGSDTAQKISTHDLVCSKAVVESVLHSLDLSAAKKEFEFRKSLKSLRSLTSTFDTESALTVCFFNPAIYESLTTAEMHNDAYFLSSTISLYGHSGLMDLMDILETLKTATGADKNLTACVWHTDGEYKSIDCTFAMVEAFMCLQE